MNSTPKTDPTKLAMRQKTKNIYTWTVVALVSLVVIISLANRHYFGRRYTPEVSSKHNAHHARRPPGVWLHGYPRKVTPVMVEVTPQKEDHEPTEKLMVPVVLHCKKVCTTGFGGADCYPIEKAILVYRDKVATIYMKFHQNAYPVILVPQPKDERLQEIKEVEQCNMDDHFPDMFLIQRHKRCAVVGNSGLLSSSGCGDAIDSHDFILRANMAPIDGYEDDVGHYTDLTVINSETLKRLYAAIVQSGPTNLDNRILLERIHNLKKSILWYPKSLNKLYQREMIRKLAVALKDHKYMDIHLAFSWKSVSVEKEWSLEGYATLGFDMFAAARRFCSNITLFGFYPFNEGPDGQRLQHHYYEDMDFKYQTAKHDFLKEFRILQNLAKKGEIRLQTKACSKQTGTQNANQPRSGVHELKTTKPRHE